MSVEPEFQRWLDSLSPEQRAEHDRLAELCRKARARVVEVEGIPVPALGMGEYDMVYAEQDAAEDTLFGWQVDHGWDFTEFRVCTADDPCFLNTCVLCTSFPKG